MNLKDRIRQNITWELSSRSEDFIPTSQQEQILSQFNDLTEDEKRELAGFIKWPEAGIIIQYLGHEKLKNHLPAFLEMLQDINWPCAGNAASMLTKAGRIMFPEISRVFREENDDAWNDWILRNIVDQWDSELIKEFKPELVQLISVGCESAQTSLVILSEQGLLNKDEINAHYRYILEKFGSEEYSPELLNYFKEEIQPFL